MALPVLTDVCGGFAPEQQFEALAVVGEAAIMHGCAAFGCLLVQVAAVGQTLEE